MANDLPWIVWMRLIIIRQSAFNRLDRLEVLFLAKRKQSSIILKGKSKNEDNWGLCRIRRWHQVYKALESKAICTLFHTSLHNSKRIDMDGPDECELEGGIILEDKKCDSFCRAMSNRKNVMKPLAG
eukprot:scaffold249401_cov35-Prasinocladus_malaysianus.AAC.1